MENSANSGEFAPGDFLFFKNNTVHAIPDLFEGPVVFLAIDTPRRDPRDIIFVNPKTELPRTSSGTARPKLASCVVSVSAGNEAARRPGDQWW